MNLQYSGQEQIARDPATVWTFVTDPDQVGHCLPDLLELNVRDATHFDATVRVGVGPVRGSFKFRFELQPDESSRRVNMKIAGGGFGSAIDLTAGADVLPAPDTGGTTLNWSGAAVMRGPVAAIGGRVLDTQAQKLIAQTFGNVRERLSARS